ncbi:MAG TPA: ABC transporter permease [Streptosporangiaceae bacterium]|nr:ABC transporter permease [Streptosporangiaceae bacterium]
MSTHKWAFVAVTATALITSAFTAAAAAFLSAVTVISVRTELTKDPGSQIVVAAPLSGVPVRRADEVVASAMRGPSSGPVGLTVAIEQSLQSGTMRLAGPHGRLTKLETQLVSLPGLAGHVRLVSGTCGGSEPAAPTVDACLSATAARALNLAVGDRATLRDAISGKPVRVLVTGIFTPLGPASKYWMLDPMGQAPLHLSSGLETAGPLVTSAAAAGSRYTVRAATWLGRPAFGQLGSSGLAATGKAIGGRLDALQNSVTLSAAIVTTDLPAEFAALATGLVVARTELLAGLLTLLVVAGATLALAVRLLAQRRAAEAALLAARGASRTQLASRAVTDAVIVAVPAAVIGPVLGAWLATALLRSALRSVTVSPPALTSGAVSSAWLAGLAVTLGSVAVVALPWLAPPPSPLRRRASQGRQRSVATAVFAQADLAVVALAAAACWQLVRSSGPVSAGPGGGSLSADPILLAAPVLALVAGALLTLRLLPVAARLGDRVAARSRGLVVPVAAWQISRRTLRQAGPTLVGVLAVAAAVMALAQRDSWHGSVQAQASFQAGADTRVTIPPAAALPLDEVTSITRADGVTASTPAVRATISLPDGNLGTLLALDTSSAMTVIPPSAAGPSRSELHTMAAAVGDDGVLLPGTPAALRLTAKLKGGAVAEPVLLVQVTDAAGIGYVLPVGQLPANGRPRTLTATLAPGNRADYPLRVTGFELQFTTPGSARSADTLSLSAGFALSTADSRTGTPVQLAPAGFSLVSATLQNPGTQSPSVISARAAASGAVLVVFNQGLGHGGLFQPLGQAAISVSDDYQGMDRPLPAVVTRSFLAATGTRVGQRLVTSVDGTTVPITLLAVLPQLPTITNGSPGVLVDQRALSDLLQAAGAQPENITEWWLKTAGPVTLRGLPPGTSTTSRAQLIHALLADPLSLGSQQALLAFAIAAVLLAIIGMLVSVATSAERSRDVALLDALGMPPRQVARLLGLEQGLTAIAPSAIGLLFGAVLSELIIPAVTLTPEAARPVPPVAVQVPWLLAAVIAVAMAILPTLAITIWMPGRRSGAARIRLEEEA